MTTALNFKDTDQFHSQKKFNHFYICHKKYLSPAFKKLLENPDDFFSEKLLKEDETFTTSVALTYIDGKPLVIKRYNIKSIWHGIKRAIQPSRAARCWHYSHLLQNYGIDTAAPIAMIEKRFGWLRRQAYFITDYIEGMDGFSIFRENSIDAIKQTQYANAIIQLIHQLHANLISHGDLKATNFIYHNSRPYIIDLDAMQRYANAAKAKRKFARDRRIFLLNWQNHPSQDYFKNF